MAILRVDVKVIIAEGDKTGNKDTVAYLVVTDSEENALTVRANTHPDLPKKGDSNGAGLVATAIKVTRDKESKPSNQIFEYEVTFTYPDLEYIENPLDRPAIIRGSSLDHQFFKQKDRAGNLYASSAKEMYDAGGMPLYAQGQTLTIIRNEEFNPIGNSTLFSKSSNSSTWHGVAAGCAYMESISYEPKRENFVPFWEVTYVIKILRPTEDEPKAWRHYVYDSGNYSIDLFGKKENIVTKDGTRGRGFLDGEGGYLGDNPSVDALVYFPEDGFVQMEEKDWGELDLPDPFAELT